MKTIQISRSVLETLYGDSTESITEVFHEFLKSDPDIKTSLFSSCNSDRIELLELFLHHNGPSFMYLGMPFISTYFRELEIKCKESGDRSLISYEFPILLQMIERSRLMIIKELEMLTSNYKMAQAC